MTTEESSPSLKRLLSRAHEDWRPEDVVSFHSAFQALATALDTIDQYPFKIEDEPAYPSTIRTLTSGAKSHD